jgi:flagellar biosynthetic protein FliP
MFCEIGGYEWTGELADIPTSALIPAFMVSELRTAFIIGFVIYIPFLVIDMVVASALMSMGMMMLPPTTISMPFKILLFVLADGWNLVIVNLVKTFY